MKFNHQEANIWDNIKQFKLKLKSDRQQLETIKSDFTKVRGSSAYKINSKQQKQNQAFRANLDLKTQVKNDLKKCRSKEQQDMIQLKKNHRNEIKQLIQKHQNEINQLKQNHIKHLEQIQKKHEEILQQKNAYIEMLQSSLNSEKQDSIKNHQVQQIKQYYQNQLIKMKQKYQNLINNLSEQNQQLSTKRSTDYNLTFKNLDQILQNEELIKQLNKSRTNKAIVTQSFYYNLKNNQKNLANKLIFPEQMQQRIYQKNKIFMAYKDKLKLKKQNSFNDFLSISRGSSQRQDLNQDLQSVQYSSVIDYDQNNLLKLLGEKQWDDAQIQNQTNFMHTIKSLKTSHINQ